MRRLTTKEVHEHKVAELGLDPSALDLTSIEAIAGALRRTASYLCPCSSVTLVRAAVRPLRGLVDDLDTLRDRAEETLEAMVATGDLLEHREFGDDVGRVAATLLFAAPPSFVSRDSGAVILVGLASDRPSALPEEMEPRIEYVNHVRRLIPRMNEDLRNELSQLGLIELPYSRWLRAPPAETPGQHLSRLDHLLESTLPSRDIPGLIVLDPTRPVRFYRGRWAEPRAQTGRFVARRRQAYGADLWCYIQLRDGHPERLIDLPLAGSRWRGCDEAWRLQLAIDALRAEPQRFRVRLWSGGAAVIELFSPLPMWARRRWEAVGEPVPRSGCLFAYRFRTAELEEEIRFARDEVWLDEWGSDGQPE